MMKMRRVGVWLYNSDGTLRPGNTGKWVPVADVEYADEDESGQLALGVQGEQRAIPTLAAPRPGENEATWAARLNDEAIDHLG